MTDAGPGSDPRLVQAALANLHLLADLLERARLDLPPRRDADLGGGPGVGEASAIIIREPSSDTPPAPAPEAAASPGASFWDDP